MTRSLFPVVLLFAVLGVADRSYAALIVYTATLNGAIEAPPNASPGTGFAKVTYDSVAHTLGLDVTFANLLGITTNSHIHAPTAVPGTGTAGVATTLPTFVGFPSGVQSGAYNAVLDLTLPGSFNPAFVTANGGTVAGAEAALAASLANGSAYWNIHTSQFPGGEIRGFLQAVPEPASLAIWGIGALGVIAFGRRRPRSCVGRK